MEAFTMVLGMIGKLATIGANAAAARDEDKAAAIAGLVKLDAALDDELAAGASRLKAAEDAQDEEVAKLEYERKKAAGAATPSTVEATTPPREDPTIPGGGTPT